MKTIKSIKENVNVDLLSKSFAYEDVCANDIRNIETEVTLVMWIKSNSNMNTYQVSATVNNYSYEITNIEVVNLLRELYKLSSNKFVKDVISTVGQTKKYTQKQIDVIISEMVKFEDLEINLQKTKC
jgi:hypothetical protein